ncbi:MAG TPA: lysophospholipid acyltransferase family protein [Bacteroidales bacterium]|nr:lysophospholipid acyltransferase family protein [Bacteroidales bacterium]
MNVLIYLVFRGFKFISTLIPLKLVYFISDLFAFTLEHLIKYRYDVISGNLQKSFPDKHSEEINQIRHEFYKNFSDVMLESLKGYSLSSKALLKRYKCINPEIANEYFARGKSIIFAMSHYGNWEWGTQVASRYFKHQLISFYKPFSNKLIDNYINRSRLKHGMALQSIYKTKFIFRSNDGTPKAYFLLSDQSPGKRRQSYWLKFLNQDTACLHGLESYARLFDMPVIYIDVQRVKRGIYETRLEVICNNPTKTQPGEITALYMKKLEKIVQAHPHDWLWSHRRWKMKRNNQEQLSQKHLLVEQNVVHESI